MAPLPFLAGLIAGAAAVAALRSDRGRAIINETGQRLRGAVNEAESGVRAAAEAGLGLLRRGVPEATDATPGQPADASAPSTESEPPSATTRPTRARKRATRPAASEQAAAAEADAKPMRPRGRRKPAGSDTEA